MKTIVAFFLVLCAAPVALSQASDACLEDATDRQLLAELERRLYLGGSDDNGAIATFFCDSSRYLTLSLLGPSENESQKMLYIGDDQLCRTTVLELSAIDRVTRLTVIAACTTSRYLHRYSLRTDGTLAELDRRYIGDDAACAEQRTAINSRAL